MKQIIVTTIVFIAIGIGVTVYLTTRPTNLELAKQAETRANYTEAMDYFVNALLKTSAGMKFPDKNEAKVISEDEYRNKVVDYVDWILSGTADVDNEYYTATQGIVRCTSFVDNQNFMVEPKVKPVVLEGFKILWESAFFPEMVSMPQNHIPLIEKALTNRMTMLNISSSRNYTYIGCLLDVVSAKRTDFHLYADNKTHLLAKPGNYLLICKSSATFPSGQVWESSYSVSPLTIPDSSSTITFTLQTRVSRKE